MDPADDPPPDDAHADQLRHDLLTPLTIIAVRGQLLARAVQRSATLDEAERVRLLASTAAIAIAVQALLATIDAMECSSRSGDRC